MRKKEYHANAVNEFEQIIINNNRRRTKLILNKYRMTFDKNTTVNLFYWTLIVGNARQIGSLDGDENKWNSQPLRRSRNFSNELYGHMRMYLVTLLPGYFDAFNVSREHFIHWTVCILPSPIRAQWPTWSRKAMTRRTIAILLIVLLSLAQHNMFSVRENVADTAQHTQDEKRLCRSSKQHAVFCPLGS